MVELTISPKEQEILIEVLRSYLSDLRMEIADTDRMEFREMLKERKAILIKVIEELGGSGVS